MARTRALSTAASTLALALAAKPTNLSHAVEEAVKTMGGDIEVGAADTVRATRAVLANYLPGIARAGGYTAALVAALLIAVPAARLMFLRFLLEHRGWLYRDSGAGGLPKTSSKFETRKNIYLSLAWMLGGSNPRLFALQEALPTLPVPPLASCMARLLSSLRPIVTDAQFRQVSLQVDAFQKEAGPRIQRNLVKLAAKTDNWVADWLQGQAALANRNPLPIYSNWYGVDRADTPTNNQTKRVAAVVRAALKFRYLVQTQQLPPLRLNGAVPLCMAQYNRIFGTTRVPAEGRDHVVSHTQSRHILVIRKGQLYALDVIRPKGRWLTLVETASQIDFILKDANKRDTPPMGILTARDRDTWAKLREDVLSANSRNRMLMHLVESALFCVCLEDSPPDNLDDLARLTLLGNPWNRWYDKSFQLIVFSNGVASCNAEQSSIDASVSSHLFGFVHDCEDEYYRTFTTRGVSSEKAPPLEEPQHLDWDIPDAVHRAIDDSRVVLDNLTENVALTVFQFPHYGKTFVKEMRLSPDAFIQMALTLAYYRLHRSVPFGLEVAHTRQFRSGRTEMVRTVSSATVAFIKAMEVLDETSNETKAHLLRQACAGHCRRVQEAMNGKGLERHLEALRVLGEQEEAGVELLCSPCLDLPTQILSAQAPVQRGPGGGWGLPDDRGDRPAYAVSYLVKDDNLYFHITCRQSGGCDPSQFAAATEKGLVDIQTLCNQEAKCLMSRVNSLRGLSILS